jgi:hypothetical protein
VTVIAEFHMAAFKCTLILSEDENSKLKLKCTYNTRDKAGEVVLLLLWAQESEGQQSRWQRNSLNEKKMIFYT